MVRNIHERRLPAPAATVGGLLDSLSGPDDRLWPRDRWPAMRFDRPLGVGADGGHGPIRYAVQEYEPGRRVRFRFNGPRGVHGWHEYAVEPATDHACVLRHHMEMTLGWPAVLTWPLVFRPLHDALIEDSLDRAARTVSPGAPASSRWSPRVRLLRSLSRIPLPRRRPSAG